MTHSFPTRRFSGVRSRTLRNTVRGSAGMDGQAPVMDVLAGIRPEIAELPQSGILEVANYGREKEGLLPLWFGEGDLPTPDFISEAAIAALRDGQDRKSTRLNSSH